MPYAKEKTEHLLTTILSKEIMRHLVITFMLLMAALGSARGQQPSKNFHIYLCIGQSNMAGQAPITDEYKNGAGPRFLKMGTVPADGVGTTTISPLCEEACKADARAFAAMVSRIKERADNLLFIPETWASPERLWYAYAEHNAQCVAPFAIEDAYCDSFFVGSIKVLHELLPFISKAQGSGRMRGFMRLGEEESADFDIADYHFHVEYLKQLKRHFGLVIQTAPDEFLFSGMGARIYISNSDTTLVTRFTNVRDVRLADGKWEATCLLNGDQTRHNGCINLRGRTTNAPCGDIPAPLTDISFSRMTWPENANRFILPGIFTAKIFTIPTQ